MYDCKERRRRAGTLFDSVKDLVDEIIIVDTGSKDRTKEIAHTYTDNVFDFVWIDDFAAARNFAFSKQNVCIVCGSTQTM